MKNSISILVSFAFLLGMVSCESIGVGPKQTSQISFDLVNADGSSYYPDHLSFSLAQFNTSTPYQGFGAPDNQSADSVWVGRVVSIDTSPIGDLDSLQAISFSLHFFQKEAKDLLVLNSECNCLDYPDAETFAERFFSDGKQLTERQNIYATYRRTFALFESDRMNSEISIKAIKRLENTLYFKADFDFSYGNLLGVFTMQNGDFQLEIPY